jgi:DNA-directed RNA polymerase III subunit RPC11
MLTFCPCCANTLYPTRTLPSSSPSDNPTGQNTLACRTCPYQFLIQRTYFERKEMKRKEVEDVMGGKEAWANVDQADGESCAFCLLFLRYGREVGGMGVYRV